VASNFGAVSLLSLFDTRSGMVEVMKPAQRDSAAWPLPDNLLLLEEHL
jgi:hypothetical protein